MREALAWAYQVHRIAQGWEGGLSRGTLSVGHDISKMYRYLLTTGRTSAATTTEGRRSEHPGVEALARRRHDYTQASKNAITVPPPPRCLRPVHVEEAVTIARVARHSAVITSESRASNRILRWLSSSVMLSFNSRNMAV